MPSNDEVLEAINGNWISVKSGWPFEKAAFEKPGISKTILTVGNTLSSLGLGVAQVATGALSTFQVASAIAAGTAVAAGPLGMAIAAASLTVVSLATNLISVNSSLEKERALKMMMAHKGWYSKGCKCICPQGNLPNMSGDHALIFEKILPFIVQQKSEKAKRKGASMVPVIGGLAMGVYRFGRMFKKNRGAVRGFYANVLTRHLVTHDCRLANDIVGILWSRDEMMALRMMPSEDADDFIALKMKSI